MHASGEVWTATNFDIRAAMMQAVRRRQRRRIQKACAERRSGAVTACPGNRRWMQLVFDSFLLMAVSQVSMVDARDAMLAADRIRFGGANQDLLWNAFAKRGLGEGAASDGPADVDPVPSFASPFATEATVRFKPRLDGGTARWPTPSCSSATTRPAPCRWPTPTPRHALRRRGPSWCPGTLRVRGPGARPRARPGRPDPASRPGRRAT